MPKRSSKRQKDTQELARHVLDAVVPDAEQPDQAAPPYAVAAVTSDSLPKTTAHNKNPAAVSLGRLGGKRGGLARARKLSAQQRKKIAQKAAATRWAGKKKKKQ